MDVRLNYKESWAPKNWCFWTVELEKTLKSLLDFKKIQPVHPKGDQSWVLIGRTDAEAEVPILWPPDGKNWLIGKTPILGKIEDRRRKGRQAQDGWMASPTEWTWVWASRGVLKDREAWCAAVLWGHRELDRTERLDTMYILTLMQWN